MPQLPIAPALRVNTGDESAQISGARYLEAHELLES